MRELIVLGGPNGAGKTSAAQIVVPGKLAITEFVNADEIARGLSPFNPEGAAFAAGRLMLQRMRSLASGDRDFAIETTCSGRGHINFLRDCKQMGWRITLVFLWLPSPQLALERVAKRVASGAIPSRRRPSTVAIGLASEICSRTISHWLMSSPSTIMPATTL